MKTKITFLLMTLSILTLKAQDEWEPQTHFTGYINNTSLNF